MKVIFYHNADLYLDLKKASGQLRPKHPEDIKPRLFTKYFPKYLKRISLDLRNGPTRSKIKRTKIIQEFSHPFTFYHRSDWRILLGNKMKTLKVLNTSFQSEQQLAQKLQLLSGLKSLCVDLPRPRAYGLIDNRDSLKVSLKNINCLRNLQFLSISHLTNKNKALLQKLDQSPRLATSLRTFCLVFNARTSLDNSELLQAIGSKKNVLKSLTSLNLGSLCSPSHFTDFENLADSCPKLQHLAFQSSCKVIKYNPSADRISFGRDFPVETNYLATLKTFINLKSLKLEIADTFTCLKDLILPPSIQHLALNFQQYLSKEIMLKIDPTPQASKTFEENETFLQFYDKFRCLGSLETLNIDFSIESDPQAYQYQSNLLHSLLKRIPTLREFTSGVSGRCPNLNRACISNTRDPYLPQVFESCHHLGQTLQTLEIGHEKVIYAGFDLSASRNKFPQLSTIKITGKFEDFNEFKPPILPLLEQLVLLGDSVSRIKILTYTENTVRLLLSLLQQVSCFKMPEKLHLEVEVRFFGLQSLEDLKGGFEDEIKKIVEQGALKVNRTSLKIHTRVRSEQMKKFLDVFGEKFEYFKCVPFQ